MPIDAKRIAEWKGLAFAPIARGDSVLIHRSCYEVVAEAVPSLLAEREELIALLREIEWKGKPSSDAYIDPVCPACGCFDYKGHAPGCRLAAFLKG